MEMMKKFRKVSYEVSNKRVKRAYQPYLHLSSIALFSDNIAGADLLTENPTAGFLKIRTDTWIGLEIQSIMGGFMIHRYIS
jgi:hypothetical protein